MKSNQDVTYGVSIISVCTDNEGDAQKMWCLLHVLMPWLIVLVCWAHQINLIVGDYLSLWVDFLTCLPKAFLVIKWMNNHSRALGMLHWEQLQTYNKTLSLILPVITWWTAHYLSLCWLLMLKCQSKCVGWSTARRWLRVLGQNLMYNRQHVRSRPSLRIHNSRQRLKSAYYPSLDTLLVFNGAKP